MDPLAGISRKMVGDEAHLVRNFEHSIHMICQDEWDKQKLNPESVKKFDLFKL